jgi:menaquinone-dependent protoporphyrinogen oxidase
MRALVAYGSRHGSTREVAERIGARLEALGHEVDVLDASDVDGLGGYDLAVVGSGIYAGLLRHRVTRLLHRIARQHPETPVAVFALGPLSREDEKPEEWASARTRIEHVVGNVGGLEVVATEVFGGVIDPERMNFLFSHMDAVDLRDWTAIDAWAEHVALRTHVRVA